MYLDKMDLKSLKDKATFLRKEMITIVSTAKSSHIGGMLSCLDIVSYLYYKRMNFSKDNYKNKDRDRFILSKGHASLVVYAILADMGIIPREYLKEYCTDGGKLIGHLDYNIPGVEVSTGSLGHGLPMAAGIALANKMDKLDSRTYCLIGDGECNEGSIWESLIFIARAGLKNLVIIVDANRLQGYDFCDYLCKRDTLKNMLKSTGLNYYELNGHNFSEIEKTFREIDSSDNNKAHIIFADTVKGKGVSYMEGRLEWHYKSPNEEELKQAIGELK